MYKIPLVNALERMLYVVHIYVMPPYVEVFGAQVVVRYQGETQLY
jgi:hypothetical protein